MLRVPGSSTAEFDGHVAPHWCATCPPSSAIYWAYVRLFSTSTYLTNHRSFHTDPARRMRMHAGNLERRFGTRVMWLGFLVRRARPGYGRAVGQTTWGQRCPVDDRAKPRLNKLRVREVRTTQEWPGPTPANIQTRQSQSFPKPQSQRRAKPRSIDRSPATSSHQSRRLTKRHNTQKESRSLTRPLEPPAFVNRSYVFARI